MLTACLVPIALQAIAMVVDEGVFHRRRELPRWERIGHPLDTLTIIVCLVWLLVGGGLTGYIVLAIASTLFVTKDEGVHAKHCTGGEQWLHAVLFALHPIVLASFGYLAHTGERGILVAQFVLTLAFMTYQYLYWNLPQRGRTINNSWYADLGERWYAADDTPIALLRAESRQRNPWIADEIVRAFGPQPQRVLDLGCGGGFLSNYLAAHGHWVTGVDTTPENLAIARARALNIRVDYDLADACALPYPDASFDVVCAMDLIEHVPEPERLIAEVGRVLKPGGQFFFHTFNRTWLANLIVIKGVAWFVRNAPENLHVIDLFRTPGEIDALCEANGLEIVTLHGSRPRFRWPLLRMLLTGRVGDDFAFTFTNTTAIGYTGVARRLHLRATNAPHERVVPEVHERDDHRDRP